VTDRPRSRSPRSARTATHETILAALNLPETARYFSFIGRRGCAVARSVRGVVAGAR
jgi:hypothetical protein